MTTAARPLALARRTSYFAVSRSHRYSILFALPLLLGYEALAAMLARPGHAELRNGADAILRGAFTAVAGARGPLIFMAVISLIGVGLIIRDLRASRDRIRPIVFLGMLGEGYGALGDTARASELLAEAFERANRTGERFYECELHRLKGELHLKGEDTDAKRAEDCFCTAIDVARKQDAKSWELRATISLARLLAKQDRRDEARAILAEIYNWFTEGFDTADLKDAKALLDELAT